MSSCDGMFYISEHYKIDSSMIEAIFNCSLALKKHTATKKFHMRFACVTEELVSGLNVF